MLQVGDKAPMAKLKNQKGEIVDFKQILDSGKKIMLLIYPKDDTPGCTAQLCGVRDTYKELIDVGLVVYGLNHDDAKSHVKFIEKYSLPFDLLIDENREYINELGSTKMFFKNKVTQRSAFVIDTNGEIIFVAKGHQDNQEILNLLKNK